MNEAGRSYWLGVAVLFFKLVTVVFFLLSCLIAFRWVQAQGTGLKFSPAGFWTWLSNDENKDQFEPLLALPGLVGAPVAGVTAFILARLQSKTSSSPDSPARPGSGHEEWERVRPKVINVVRLDWVKAHLQNLVKSPWIHLGVEEVPDAHALSPDIERLVDRKQERVTRRSLVQLFEESGERLLILGEPGSGKTITLVKLCEALPDRAEKDTSAPVPVALRLASWAIKRLPFEQWMVEELKEQNLGSPTIINALESGHRIILLLDGLDEVGTVARAACLTAIETYRKTHVVPLVVCCRWEEYHALPEAFVSIHALRILPLTPGQIDAYLSRFGERLVTLRRHLETRPELEKLTETPLMLGIITQIYLTGANLAELPDDASSVAWRDAVFQNYVKIMFARKSVAGKTPVVPSQAIHYLQQIARCMQQWNLPVLYLEQLHCGWLRKKWRYVLNFTLINGLIVNIISIIGFVFFLPMGKPVVYLAIEVLILNLFFSLLSGLWAEQHPSPPALAVVHLSGHRNRLISGFKAGLKVAVMTVFIGMLLGILPDLLSGRLARRLPGIVVSWLAFYLLFGLLIVPAFALVIWWLKKTVDPEPVNPNQGIFPSLLSGLIGAVVLSSIGAAVGFPFAHMFSGWAAGLLCGLYQLGFSAALMHYSTRLSLAWENILPFPLNTKRLIIFLDTMSGHILLRRVGGGWIFSHRLLLEYLADEPFGKDPQAIEKQLRQGRTP